MAGRATRKNAAAAEAARTGHNRKKLIVETCTHLATLDAKIKRLQEERREIVSTNIRGSLGMKVADFNAAYRLSKLENDDRDTMIDTVVETFSALGLGRQLDMFRELKSTDKESSPKGSTSDNGDPQPAAA